MIELRPFHIDDAAAVARLVGDQAVSKWTAKIPYPYTVEDAVDWIQRTTADPSRNPFAVDFDKQLVACVSFWPSEPGTAEVGYWVGKAFWGRGIGSTALRKLIDDGHLAPNKAVLAKINSENTGSQRVLEKCGFKFLETCTLTRGEQQSPGKIYTRKL